MSRHARRSKPLSQSPATAAGIHGEPFDQPGRSHRRRSGSAQVLRPGGPTRTVLAVCCTALAAGAGGMLSGLVPLPGGSDTVVAAGDAHSAGTTATAPGTTGRTGAGTGSMVIGTAAAPANEPGVPSRPSQATGRDQDRSPVATPSPAGSLSLVVAPAPGASAGTVAATAADAASPSASASDTATRDAVAAAVLTLVNQERAKAGCDPLVSDPQLAALAIAFSDDMAARNFFDHVDPDGRNPWDRATAVGISYLGGENIARGQQTAQEVMDAWMNSSGHRANILDCAYTRIGIGVHEGTGGPWWVQDFGF